MSKLEVREIGPISGETEVRLADGATAVGFGGETPVKAWVNFDAKADLTIRGSMNVSSVSDNGVGDYTVNFATEMLDSNYAVSGIVTGWTSYNGLGDDFATNPSSSYHFQPSPAQSSTYCGIGTSLNNHRSDFEVISVLVVR